MDQYPDQYTGILCATDGATYFDGAAGYIPADEGWMQGQYDGWPADASSTDVCLVPADADSAWGVVYDQAQWSPDTDGKSTEANAALEVTISEPSSEISITGNRLDWTVPDTWADLRALPTQSHVASPVFDVKGSPGMQLEFYPSGKKSTEAGFCTLQLVRGLESKVGLKFELCLNGRSNGPKACLGRRFLADYQKPFDDSDSTESQQVVVSFLVLSTF